MRRELSTIQDARDVYCFFNGIRVEFFWRIVGYGQYVAIVGIIGAIIGSLFLLSDKTNKQVGKFVFCIISAIACLIMFIIIVTGFLNKGSIQ